MGTDERGVFHLRRTWFKTDVTEEEPEYVGTQSDPARKQPGEMIVSVDWSTRGEVEVTYMTPGPGPGRS